MGKALAVQSARAGNAALSGAFGGARAYRTRVPRANLHTTRPQEARAVENGPLRRERGMCFCQSEEFAVGRKCVRPG